MNDTQSTHQAVTVREIQLSELGTVHGVTCDNDGHVWFAEGDGDKGNLNVNVVPLPYSDSTDNSPFIIRASSCEIESPSPTPRFCVC